MSKTTNEEELLERISHIVDPHDTVDMSPDRTDRLMQLIKAYGNTRE